MVRKPIWQINICLIVALLPLLQGKISFKFTGYGARNAKGWGNVTTYIYTIYGSGP